MIMMKSRMSIILVVIMTMIRKIRTIMIIHINGNYFCDDREASLVKIIMINAIVNV